MADYNGAAGDNVNLRVNQTAAGFFATVQDQQSGNATRFKVAGDDGKVTVFSQIDYSGGNEHILNVLAGGSATEILWLEQSGLSRIEFSRDSANTRARMKASTAGDTMRIEGDVVSLNTPNATGDIARFQSNGNGRLTVNWDGTSTTLKCDDFMVIHYSGTTVGTRDLSFRHTTSGGTDQMTARIGETGTFDFCDGTNSNVEATLVPNDGAAAKNCTLNLGKVGGTRGVLVVERDNTGGALRPGIIRLGTQDNVNGVDIYLYAYYDGAQPAGSRNQLRAHNADPGATNVGTVLATW